MSVVSHNPRTGDVVTTAPETTTREVHEIAARAANAGPLLAETSPRELRSWLRAVADALEVHRDELASLAENETALGLERLTGEVTRAANQLRFYGDVAVEGSHLGVAIDPRTDTTPELVRVNRPLGPVAVFGASNFPFAFSVLGNDTGAALAAGCPVIVKAHPAHLGLSLRQADIAKEALTAAGAPDGTFDIVVGRQAGVDLVTASSVAAVAFTGSQSGGLALWRLANDREIVIPVYAEMGTVNPVVVSREAAQDMTAVADGFVGSFTLGHGQFCTKPGLLLAPAGCDAAEEVARALRSSAPAPVMLTEAIAGDVTAGISELESAGATVVEILASERQGWSAPAAVLRADIDALRPGSRLLEECFGAVAVVCEYSTDEQLDHAIMALQSSLAASLISSDEHDPQAPHLIDILSQKVGRVTVNDWPTGVAFTWAQQHGGPWPSTSVASATSVGAAGLTRFVRPVAYQSAPDSWLPPAARAANPWQLPRRIAGDVVGKDHS